ncbi:MAG: hypothetical protein IJR72_02615 [Oscillospiraceae bacterium]|nr:hypothetical protein [Oscillospiraceae bacterium]
MILFDGIQETGLALLEGITTAAANITQAFSSPEMVRVTRFIANIAPVLRPLVARIPAPEAVREILQALVVDIIPTVARLLLRDVPGSETAEQLGRKIERAAELDMEPEDFDSTEEYLKHIRENIPDEAPGFFEAMDEKERLKYASVGSGVYVRGLEEKYGVTLNPEFWNAVRQSGMRKFFSVETLIRSLREHGVTDGTLLNDFFSSGLRDDPYERECVEGALRDAMLQVGADVFRDQIDACIETYRREMSGQGNV